MSAASPSGSAPLLAADLEIFRLAIRGRGISAQPPSANWLANPVVALTCLDFVDLLGRPGVFFVFAALAFGALLYARFFVPETKGLSLEAVEALRVRRMSNKKPTIAPAQSQWHGSSSATRVKLWPPSPHASL